MPLKIEEGTVIAGKYRLASPLGDGGMGAVWKAEHLQLGAPVAVKFMHEKMLGETVARSRFEREARAAALIRSPHVVHTYDHGVDQGTPFIVLEFLEGEDLAARMSGKKTIALDEAVRICTELCKGLHRAHGIGIVHRDLKPGNVFLSAPDDDLVKILDFGIAKETGTKPLVPGEATTTGDLVGSPHYMSPEQVRGNKLDGRSDLWSVGVILYRMVTGTRPFDANDLGDLIVRICVDDPETPSSLVDGLHPDLDAFFVKAFEREPEDRFQNAQELAEAFARAAEKCGKSVPIPTDSKTGWEPPSDASRDAATKLLEPSVSKSLRAKAEGAVAEETKSDMTRSTAPDRENVPPPRSRAGLFVAAGAVLVLVAAGAVVMRGGDGESTPRQAATTTSSSAPPVASATAKPSSAPAPSASAAPSATSASSASASPTPAPAPAARNPPPIAKPKPLRPAPPKPRPAPRPPVGGGVDLGY